MDYLDEDSVARVLSNLVDRTSSGQTVWETANQDFEFVTSGKKFVYFIASGDKDDLPPYVFEIWNGNPLQVNSGAAKLQSVQTGEFSAHNETLAELYATVKRKVLRTDVVAGEILSDFD